MSGSGDDQAPRRLLDRQDFAARIAQAKAAGERVVMTNGCFDLLHPGHLHYLRQAAALGQRLGVALNDDASVARLKGPRRPVCPLADRAALLLELRCVDWVTSFHEDTPAQLIAQCLPDILVKGGDYQGQERDIPGGQAVRDGGGEVRILGFLDGHSSTALIERLRGG